MKGLDIDMTFAKCVSERRSIRKYRAEDIPDEVLAKVIKDASYAPSWKNSQTTRYIVIKDDALKAEIAQTCMMDFKHNHDIVMNAPVLILVTTIKSRSGYERDGSLSTGLGTHWESFDAGIATQTLCLSAHSNDLGTVILGIFNTDKVVRAAKVPEGQKLSALVAIGYPDESPDMPKRKGTDELIDYRR